MRTLLVLLLSLPMAFAAPVPKELKKQTDAACFVGTWEITTLRSNGKPLGKAHWTFDESLKMISDPLPVKREVVLSGSSRSTR